MKYENWGKMYLPIKIKATICGSYYQHSDPDRENKGRKYKISEKSNLVKTFIVIYGLKEDTLRFKVKQKVDFCDF